MELTLLAESRKIVQDVIFRSIPVGQAMAAFSQGKREVTKEKKELADIKRNFRKSWLRKWQ